MHKLSIYIVKMFFVLKVYLCIAFPELKLSVHVILFKGKGIKIFCLILYSLQLWHTCTPGSYTRHNRFFYLFKQQLWFAIAKQPSITE